MKWESLRAMATVFVEKTRQTVQWIRTVLLRSHNWFKHKGTEHAILYISKTKVQLMITLVKQLKLYTEAKEKMIVNVFCRVDLSITNKGHLQPWSCSAISFPEPALRWIRVTRALGTRLRILSSETLYPRVSRFPFRWIRVTRALGTRLAVPCFLVRASKTRIENSLNYSTDSS